jgi:hypothetical protein
VSAFPSSLVDWDFLFPFSDPRFAMQEMMKGYDKLYKKCHMLLEKMIKNEDEVKPVTEYEKSLAGQMKLPMFPYITKNFSLH